LILLLLILSQLAVSCLTTQNLPLLIVNKMQAFPLDQAMLYKLLALPGTGVHQETRANLLLVVLLEPCTIQVVLSDGESGYCLTIVNLLTRRYSAQLTQSPANSDCGIEYLLTSTGDLTGTGGFTRFDCTPPDPTGDAKAFIITSPAAASKLY
jgi:hypothetical protein